MSEESKRIYRGHLSRKPETAPGRGFESCPDALQLELVEQRIRAAESERIRHLAALGLAVYRGGSTDGHRQPIAAVELELDELREAEREIRQRQAEVARAELAKMGDRAPRGCGHGLNAGVYLPRGES